MAVYRCVDTSMRVGMQYEWIGVQVACKPVGRVMGIMNMSIFRPFSGSCLCARARARVCVCVRARVCVLGGQAHERNLFFVRPAVDKYFRVLVKHVISILVAVAWILIAGQGS